MSEAAEEFQIPEWLLWGIGNEMSGLYWKPCEASISEEDILGGQEHPQLEFGPFGLSREEVTIAGKLLGKPLTLKEIHCDVSKSAKAQAVLIAELAKSHLKDDTKESWQATLLALAKQKWPAVPEGFFGEFVNSILKNFPGKKEMIKKPPSSLVSSNKKLGSPCAGRQDCEGGVCVQFQDEKGNAVTQCSLWCKNIDDCPSVKGKEVACETDTNFCYYR